MVVTAERLDWLRIARAALGWEAEARIELADFLQFETADEALAGIADVLRVVRISDINVRISDKRILPS